MISSSVFIILREALEAALLISLLLSFSYFLKMGFSWVVAGITFGSVAGLVYALNLSTISNCLDGVGQEVSYAFLQITLTCILFFLSLLLILKPKTRAIKYLMIIAVSIAIIREGSEIYLYISSFTSSEELFSTAALGSSIGLGIGMSIGALIFYSLCGLQKRTFMIIGLALMTLVAAGLCSQAITLLIQADWLTVNEPVWDSSNLLPEQSILGQLLYALIGYEATPSIFQVSSYSAVVVIFITANVFCYRIDYSLNKKKI